MSTITTHILDTARGCPAEAVKVILYRVAGSSGEKEVAIGYTNKDGRIADWVRAGGEPALQGDEGWGTAGAGLDTAGAAGSDTADAAGLGKVDAAGLGMTADADSGTANAAGSDGKGHADMPSGIYKIRFETRGYFQLRTVASFYPWVDIYFEVGVQGHCHVPLLISPYGYSTYRGS